MASRQGALNPMLYDNHGRPLNYLRLSVTDRCNLRCTYCLPESGVTFLPRTALLSFEEIVRLTRLLVTMGIRKVRLTGGEPFLRKDFPDLIKALALLPQVQIHITTNGVLTAPHVPQLKQLGVASVNLSLDTLDRTRFAEIAHRDEFPAVWKTLEALLAHAIPLKLNCVVMEGINTEAILPMVQLTSRYPIDVRFIEEMPFNGKGLRNPSLRWTARAIYDHIKGAFPEMRGADNPPHSTSTNYAIPGHKGTVGIIAAYSRTFCHACDRIRITAQGQLKTCLYDNGVLDLRSRIREGATDDEIRKLLLGVFHARHANGFEAEATRATHTVSESMSTIGG